MRKIYYFELATIVNVMNSRFASFVTSNCILKHYLRTHFVFFRYVCLCFGWSFLSLSLHLKLWGRVLCADSCVRMPFKCDFFFSWMHLNFQRLINRFCCLITDVVVLFIQKTIITHFSRDQKKRRKKERERSAFRKNQIEKKTHRRKKVKVTTKQSATM